MINLYGSPNPQAAVPLLCLSHTFTSYELRFLLYIANLIDTNQTILTFAQMTLFVYPSPSRGETLYIPSVRNLKQQVLLPAPGPAIIQQRQVIVALPEGPAITAARLALFLIPPGSGVEGAPHQLLAAASPESTAHVSPTPPSKGIVLYRQS